MFYFFYILVIAVRPIISTSTGPIFTKFAGLVQLCHERSEVIFFDTSGAVVSQCHPILWAKSTSIPRLVVRMTFAMAAPPAFDKQGNCYTGGRQTNNYNNENCAMFCFMSPVCKGGGSKKCFASGASEIVPPSPSKLWRRP